ncbi:MAG: HD-GYP domain-containing protein [Spirochaetota bacterium]
MARKPEYFRELSPGHLARVAAYAVIVARRYGLSERELGLLARAARLHDIGKLAVPGGILRKEGPLNGRERVEARKHTVYGALMLQGDTNLLRMARMIALSHHERWDGSGYPLGLKGSRIPLHGQIVSIADVFDALTSERSYKKPYSLDHAVRIIRSGRRGMFDPDVVRAFARGLDAIAQVLSASS